MGLQEYQKKRDLARTPEPAAHHDTSGGNRFVVQRHQARRLHFDLRLEMGGVLKSWAVPKGPSMNPADRRLAIQTEDHPVKYLNFHGVIPTGNYGAGEMHIWDSGTFSVSGNAAYGAEQQWQLGMLHLHFNGSKLQGAFSLVRLKNDAQPATWLLIKKKDRHATATPYDAQKAPPRAAPLPAPHFIEPMLAETTGKIFDDPDWIYELKWDGYRVQATVDGGTARLFSRNGQNYTHRYPAIAATLAGLDHQVVLDGELVVIDRTGRHDFAALQNYSPDTASELRYYVFDMLFLNGLSMLELPLIQRKSLLLQILDQLHQNPVLIAYCEHSVGRGTSLYAQAMADTMEGVIAKKAGSAYYPGRRSDQWLKIKTVSSVEAIICGYTDSVTGAAPFGSLILGRYQDGQLRFIGNCGSGFTSREHQTLLARLRPLTAATSPFAEAINLRGRTAHWLRPQLVCTVKFSEWTDSGRLRHPVYQGLRADKNPPDIHLVPANESPQAATKEPAPLSPATSLEVGGITVPISNLDKIYWPASGRTKYDLIDYYLHLAETILPYLRDRPQSLHRHPDGIEQPGFFQKDHERLPDWVQTVAIYSASSAKDINYLLCQNEATLLYMANLGCIEINSWNSRVGTLDAPDYTVIDLDPSENNSFDEVIEVAQVARAIVDTAGIEARCKTSGSTGLHIYIPLGGAYSYQEGRDFARILCALIQARLPQLTSMERAVKNRRGKIYLDYLQNRRGQTLAAPYCLRPRPGAPVSAPLSWDEVKVGLKIGDFNITTMRLRLAAIGDIFGPVLGEGIDMADALTKLSAL